MNISFPNFPFRMIPSPAPESAGRQLRTWRAVKETLARNRDVLFSLLAIALLIWLALVLVR